MGACLFCHIANGEVEKLVWSNEWAAAFRDIHPKAPIHLLVVPKKHIANLDELSDTELAGQLLLAVREAAHAVGLRGRYRVALNNGRAAGQIVEHLHFHLLGQAADGMFATGGAETDQAEGLV